MYTDGFSNPYSDCILKLIYYNLHPFFNRLFQKFADFNRFIFLLLIGAEGARLQREIAGQVRPRSAARKGKADVRLTSARPVPTSNDLTSCEAPRKASILPRKSTVRNTSKYFTKKTFKNEQASDSF
ncbi:hypothetical protein D9X91_13665 [Falsibacillus albus]|uniref:Uncharacterized protein n=1 Tax=Falsibacillus albus TaxID=2478915 RepID=A0A3L7JVL4_9BACI|nr:hypothetical protein D9X91_13665 [Falsibacillus albus]